MEMIYALNDGMPTNRTTDIYRCDILSFTLNDVIRVRLSCMLSAGIKI